MNSSKNKPAFSLQLKSAGPPTQMILSACSKQYEYPTAKSRLISASVERVSPFLTPREQTTQEKPEKPQTSARSTRSSFRNTTQTQLTPRDIQTLSKITSSFHTKPVTPSVIYYLFAFSIQIFNITIGFPQPFSLSRLIIIIFYRKLYAG